MAISITERISVAIWEKRRCNQETKHIYIGRHDYYDLRKAVEPYLIDVDYEESTEKYEGIEIIVVDRDRYLDVS